jgi:hypothetical protein
VANEEDIDYPWERSSGCERAGWVKSPKSGLVYGDLCPCAFKLEVLRPKATGKMHPSGDAFERAYRWAPDKGEHYQFSLFFRAGRASQVASLIDTRRIGPELNQ